MNARQVRKHDLRHWTLNWWPPIISPSIGQHSARSLHFAAVIGRRVSSTLLEHVTGLDQGLVAAALERLCDGGFLVEIQFHPHRRFRIKHALMQECAYGMVARKNRIAVHLSILDRLERDDVDAKASQLLARHARLASPGIRRPPTSWQRRSMHWNILPTGRRFEMWTSVFRLWSTGQKASSETDEASKLLGAAFEDAARCDSRFQYSELLRIKAALLAKADKSDAGIEPLLREAKTTSKEQGVGLSELISTVALAEHLTTAKRNAEARELLLGCNDHLERCKAHPIASRAAALL